MKVQKGALIDKSWTFTPDPSFEFLKAGNIKYTPKGTNHSVTAFYDSVSTHLYI
jgi:hypothetical protein